MGVDELLFGDIIGVVNFLQVIVVFEVFLLRILVLNIVFYFYDIRGMVFVNIIFVFDMGIIFFDIFLGGFGGCLYVLGLVGNVVIEDVIYMFE